MPIKKTTDPCTGIYQRWHTKATRHSDGTPDHDAMRDVLMAAGEAASNLYNHRLDDVEKYCDEILSADDPTLHIPRQNKDIKLDKLRRKEFVNDVETARRACATVRNLLSKGDTVAAINWAIQLGQTIERALTREHEVNALLGKKVIAGGHKGSKKVNSPYDVATRNADIVKQCKKLRQENPDCKQAEIDQTVGRKLKCSVSTVRRARRNNNQK